MFNLSAQPETAKRLMAINKSAKPLQSSEKLLEFCSFLVSALLIYEQNKIDAFECVI